ncbi:MAG: 1-(5-phosphoribosyl)-5-[(5-phosphoribosylamino)methylideneamino]imidazole-4-carboxamide isomerase [Elusimicrobiota bacterium]|jgi:phosphoribosylformimino-5-aminoimidazole carboxamide ribotide isomerase|nr:1-(5-phosphoribosyl)-5-[(5-phosphoribosylamino)methylideneamino]imidazole-4-carboxamide isomerase [Elusimicrobiota bacterium]
MLIIPAIDIRNGKSVRLKQGKVENETIHSDSPFETAKLWKSKGAKRLHIVDLDGAIDNSDINIPLIQKICNELEIKIEVGGGIRDIKKIDFLFNAGAEYVILGTAAIQNPTTLKEALDKYGDEKIIVALDVKDGKVAIKGWKTVAETSAEEFITKMQKLGIKEFIYTDISRDGMLSGPNFNGLKSFLNRGLRIIASGGIKNVNDIIELKKYEGSGLIGAIIGKVLYTDNFDLKKAIEEVENA